MAGNPQIVVEYVANTAKLAAASSQVDGAVGKTTGRAGKLGTALKAGFAVAGTAAIAFGKSSVSAAIESQKANAKLDQVFKSMGDSTGAAADGARNYAGALSKKIGVDDDAIIAGQTLLATFGKVSDATARSAGIFDRATAAGADLAAAGFGSLEGNAVQLGKALNDPIKGLTALGKSGVTFTDQEKARIKTMVESGRVTDAQKVILKAIEKQVGGTAAASATGGEKMAVAFGEFQESVGGMLLPAIEKLTPLLTRLGTWMSEHPKIVYVFVAALAALAVAVMANNVALAITAIITGPITLTMLAIIAAIAALVVIAIILYKNWDKVTAKLKAGAELIKGAFLSALNWLKRNWPLILGILGGPLALAVVLVIRHWDRVKDALRAALDVVKGILGKIADWFGKPADAARTAAGAIKAAFNGVLDFLRGLKEKVSSAAGKVADAIKAPVNAVIGAFNALQLPRVQIPGLKTPGPIPDIPGFGYGPVNFPDIPKLAAGGIVTAPTLALIGEAGPEAVVPLGRAGGPLVHIDQVVVREEMDVARIAARLSAAVAVRA